MHSNQKLVIFTTHPEHLNLWPWQSYSELSSRSCCCVWQPQVPCLQEMGQGQPCLKAEILPSPQVPLCCLPQYTVWCCWVLWAWASEPVFCFCGHLPPPGHHPAPGQAHCSAEGAQGACVPSAAWQATWKGWIAAAVPGRWSSAVTLLCLKCHSAKLNKDSQLCWFCCILCSRHLSAPARLGAGVASAVHAQCGSLGACPCSASTCSWSGLYCLKWNPWYAVRAASTGALGPSFRGAKRCCFVSTGVCTCSAAKQCFANHQHSPALVRCGKATKLLLWAAEVILCVTAAAEIHWYLQVLVRATWLQLRQQEDNKCEGMFPNIC